MVNKKASYELNNLTRALIKDLKGQGIEYIDLLAYNRAKNHLTAKKYYGED